MTLKTENDLLKVEEKPVGMGKIMQYYHPKWLAYLVYLVTAVHCFKFPLYGFVFAKFMFILLVP